ncbi:hypothetical protein C8R43DRAFT_1155836 [Mycena crocata]|nr:hypothetical protein C8R43DRAFT_1155836 [Mycena crocata]
MDRTQFSDGLRGRGYIRWRYGRRFDPEIEVRQVANDGLAVPYSGKSGSNVHGRPPKDIQWRALTYITKAIGRMQPTGLPPRRPLLHHGHSVRRQCADAPHPQSRLRCCSFGEIVLSLDGGEEKTVKTGEIMVQRGANHAWHNRTNEPCLVLEDGTALEETVIGKKPE